MFSAEIITECDSEWGSPALIVPEANGKLRLVCDYKWLNQFTLPDPFMMPRIDDLVDLVGGARYLTKIDCTKGYWSIPLDEESIPLTGFTTPHGHFCWHYIPWAYKMLVHLLTD